MGHKAREEDFRLILRDATRVDHERLDTAISAQDVAAPAGLAGFLRIHRVAFEALAPATAPDSRAAAMLREMIACIDDDLHSLDAASLGQVNPVLTEVMDPLAVDYVLDGSRLGTLMLRKRWQATHFPAVTAAGRYFEMPVDASNWKATCAALSAIPPDSARAKQITAHTIRIFDLFLEVAIAEAASNTRTANAG